MKKVLLSVALVLALGLGANAQRDNFFNDWEDFGNGLDRTSLTIDDLGLPAEHGLIDNLGAPLGSGLLILTALGAGYALRKRNEE